MASLKQNLKQILVNRQHKRYEREIASKNLTYDIWIREQEEKIPIDVSIAPVQTKSLTNDFQYKEIGRDEAENDGKHSKSSEYCHMLELAGSDGHNQGKRVYLSASAGLFSLNMEALFAETASEVILLSFYKGRISEIAYALIDQCFSEHDNVVLVYGDEDTQEEETRNDPWFKPDWSPDRFLSGFYFGGLIGVRTHALKKTYYRCKDSGLIERWEKAGEDKHGEEPRQLLYMLLYEMLKEQNAFQKRSKEHDKAVYHIRQILYHSKEKGYEQLKGLRLPEFIGKEETEENTIVSVIIPSKDNPETLFHCIDSFLERTHSRYSCEIILVDNGSGEENRRRIEDKTSKLNYELNHELNNGKGNVPLTGCTYLYQKMDFNFSRMCNLGAEKAQGKLLLFLNDDMEIIQPDWMDLMIEKAMLQRVGAVGAKLLYPDSAVIQHAGITNLRVGPAHKLQSLNDETEHYFGMNRGVHNMLAVTGACLMLAKDLFFAVGGFFEGLAVAFNDVDLCYRIFEQGYYNVVRNDVILYHHESLSRGKDGESAEKQLRLIREKDLLYERHQDLYGKDPYYHPYLTTDMLESEYSPAYHYQVTLDMPWSGAVSCEKELRKARQDKCLVVGMECAMDLYKWQYGVSPDKGKIRIRPEEMGYYFQGYSFVIGADNACYKKSLLLRNQADDRIWAIAVDNRYRRDIKDNLRDQLNVDLTGFAAKMRREEIPVGVYQFGMLAEDKCSRQKLINWSNWVLEVSTDGES